MLDVRTWIEIDERSLFFNLRQFQKRARPARIMAVIKSNAYGHGLSLVAKLLANGESRIQNEELRGRGRNSKFLIPHPPLWFGVDSIVEALRLRRDGIKNPILVLGYTLPSRFKDAMRANITITISHLDGLRDIAQSRARPDFHIKFDTGMHRHGFQEDELTKLISNIKKYSLKPAGAYSHLATADDHAFSKKQIAVFDRCLEAFHAAGIHPKVIHFNKTEGILFYPRRDSLMRLGIGLYGYLPQPRRGAHTPRMPKDFVRPVMAWKTIVSEVKHIRKGEAIGYDLTYRFKHDAIIAVLPIGYWHGYDRGLSNCGEVLIHGKRASVRGRVCMDITMVETTHIPRVKIGDEVVLIGKQKQESISADEIAAKINTTAYEVLTRINPLIQRSLSGPQK